MNSYLKQLQELASSQGVSLLHAVKRAGVSDSQYYRWRDGVTRPRESTALQIAATIKKMGANNANKRISAS